MVQNLLSVLDKYWFYREYKNNKISKREFWRLLQLFKGDIKHELESEDNFDLLVKELALEEVEEEVERTHPISQHWGGSSSEFSPILQELYTERMAGGSLKPMVELLLKLGHNESFIRFLAVVKHHHKDPVKRLARLLKIKDISKFGEEKWIQEAFSELNSLLLLIDEFVSFEKMDMFIRYNFLHYFPRFCKEIEIMPTKKVSDFFDDLDKYGFVDFVVTARDILLGQDPSDFDVLKMLPYPYGMTLDEYKKRRKELEEKYEIDFIKPRRSAIIDKPNKLFLEVLGATEFTINKIFIKRELNGKFVLIVDLFGGYKDLRGRILRVYIDEEWKILEGYPNIPLPPRLVSDKEIGMVYTIRDLLLLGLRAARFTVQYSLTIENKTSQYLKNLSEAVKLRVKLLQESGHYLRYRIIPLSMGQDYVKDKMEKYFKACGNKKAMVALLEEYGFYETINTFINLE